MFFSPMSAPMFGGDEGYISVYKMACVGFLVYKMVGPDLMSGQVYVLQLLECFSIP